MSEQQRPEPESIPINKILEAIKFSEFVESERRSVSKAESTGRSIEDLLNLLYQNPEIAGLPDDFYEKTTTPKRILGLFSGSAQVERYLIERWQATGTVVDLNLPYKDELKAPSSRTEPIESDVFKYLLNENPEANMKFDLVVATAVGFLFDPYGMRDVEIDGKRYDVVKVLSSILKENLGKFVREKGIIFFMNDQGIDPLAGIPGFKHWELNFAHVYIRTDSQ